VAFLPITLMSALASGIAARLVGRVRVKLLLLVGMLALVGDSVLLSQISPHDNYLVTVLPGMLLIAIGLGVGFTVGTLTATAGVPAEQQGVASGILSTSQQIGGAVGLAVLTTVASAVTKSATGSAPQMLTDGFQAAFLGAGGFALAATLVVGVFMHVHKTQMNVEHVSQESGGVPVIGNAQTSACQPAITHLAVAQSRELKTTGRSSKNN
jgi:MFS family permease